MVRKHAGTQYRATVGRTAGQNAEVLADSIDIQRKVSAVASSKAPGRGLEGGLPDLRWARIQHVDEGVQRGYGDATLSALAIVVGSHRHL